jgi:hypothetical protein
MFAVVTQSQKDQWDEYQRGVNAVKFFQDAEGRWFCPIEMVTLLPEVFVEGYEQVNYVVMPSEEINEP